MFWSIFWSILLFFAIAGTITVIVTDSRSSAQKIIWIALVTIFPILGLILYFLIGVNYRRPGYNQRDHSIYFDKMRGLDDGSLDSFVKEDGRISEIREEYRPLVKLLRRGGASGIVIGNDVTVYTEGQEKLETLLEAIKNAKKYVHMEYFYFRKGETGSKYKEVLKQKAQEGVKVRFIRENIANFDIAPRYYNEMKSSGVDVVKFNPSIFRLWEVGNKLNYRDHRKIAIVDGEIAYTGGMNISDDYYSRWRDTHVSFKGEAVAALQLRFLDSYITSGGELDEAPEDLFPYAYGLPAEGTSTLMQIVPADPDTRWPVLTMGFEWALHNAREYIWFQTPYLCPPEPLMEALKAAALKGIDVRIMIPIKSDMWIMTQINKGYYADLLEAGVRIFLNRGRFIHSKTFVSDDYLSNIGSANLDARSLEMCYEMNTFFYDTDMALRNRSIFEEDLKESFELTSEAWSSRKWYAKFFSYIMRLLGPLL